MGVVEPLKVKTQAIKSATEAATMVLRVDDVIAAKREEMKPKPGQSPHDYTMPPDAHADPGAILFFRRGGNF